MAFNDFHVDTTASDNNGGTSEGSADVSGTAGATDGTTTIDLSGDTPDLSGVVAGDAIRIAGETGGINSSDIFEISSVNDGADTVVVVQTPGTNSGLVWAIGGAWATIDRSMNVVVGGNKVHVKASADYTETATIDTAGTLTSWIDYEGYTATKLDGGMVTIDGGSARANGIAASISTAVYYVFRNFTVKNTTGTGYDSASIDNLRFINCVADNCGSHGWRLDNQINWQRCVAKDNSGNGFDGDTHCIVAACASFGNAGSGIRINSGIITDCLAKKNDAGAETNQIEIVAGGSTSAVVGNTVDGDAAARPDTMNGINITYGTAITQIVIANNIVKDCDTAIKAASDHGDVAMSYNNLIDGSVVADYTNFPAGQDDVIDPATLGLNADYSLTSDSEAKAAGLDAARAANGTSYRDIGALQRQEAAGGGGATRLVGGVLAG